MRQTPQKAELVPGRHAACLPSGTWWSGGWTPQGCVHTFLLFSKGGFREINVSLLCCPILDGPPNAPGYWQR